MLQPTDSEPLDVTVMRELSHAFWRQQIAEFVLGPKGEHFDGDEWEWRADAWYGGCLNAEQQLRTERGL